MKRNFHPWLTGWRTGWRPSGQSSQIPALEIHKSGIRNVSDVNKKVRFLPMWMLVLIFWPVRKRFYCPECRIRSQSRTILATCLWRNVAQSCEIRWLALVPLKIRRLHQLCEVSGIQAWNGSEQIWTKAIISSCSRRFFFEKTNGFSPSGIGIQGVIDLLHILAWGLGDFEQDRVRVHVSDPEAREVDTVDIGLQRAQILLCYLIRGQGWIREGYGLLKCWLFWSKLTLVKARTSSGLMKSFFNKSSSDKDPFWLAEVWLDVKLDTGLPVTVILRLLSTAAKICHYIILTCFA